MADETSTPQNPGVKQGNDSQQSSGSDVKDQQPKDSSTGVATDVKQDQDQDTEKPAVETRRFGGFEVPVPLYESMKENFYKEGERKTLDRLEKEGLIADQTFKEKVSRFDEWSEMFGEALQPGKKLTPTEANELIEKRIRMKTDDLKNQLTMKDKELQEFHKSVEQQKQELAMERKEESIRRALMGNPEVNQSMIEDLVFLIDRENRIQMDDDLRTPYVMDAENKDQRAISKDGNFLSIKDFVNEWINTKPQYKKTADKSGVGGDYNDSKGEFQGGPPHLRNRREPVMVRKSSSGMDIPVTKRG